MTITLFIRVDKSSWQETYKHIYSITYIGIRVIGDDLPKKCHHDEGEKLFAYCTENNCHSNDESNITTMQSNSVSRYQTSELLKSS